MPAASVQQLLEEAVAHHGAGRLDQAEEIYGQVRAAEPGHFDALHLSGTLALQQGRHAEAVGWLHRALESNGRSAVCAMRLGLAHAALGQPAEAEKHLRTALRRQPDLPEAWDHLGFVLRAQSRLAEAISCHERAVALRPNFAEGWHHLGLALHRAGRPAESLSAQDRAVRQAPRQAALHYGRGLALQQCYRLDEAIAALETALAFDPDLLAARSLRLHLLMLTGAAQEKLSAEQRAFGAAFAGPASRSASSARTPARPLRVALLASDLSASGFAGFVAPILDHLDRVRFSVWLYQDQFTPDKVPGGLRERTAGGRNFSGWADAAVEQAIRADAPDLLVDLTGHGAGNRLPVLARRVAEVQIAYLGHPGTTGLGTMDYRFTDAVCDPPGESGEWHSEQLVRFSPAARVYRPPADSPPVVPVPPCQDNGFVTFGSFNDFNLAGPDTLAAWSLLLRSVPYSRLRLKSAGFDEPSIATAVRARLQGLGMPDERLELCANPASPGEQLALYHGVDIALDTFPVHGPAATCEALWMGVPVVTLAGGHAAARTDVSVLRSAGHPEWIARDWNGYVKIAAGLAGNAATLAEVRTGLRKSLQESALFDHAGHAARFGDALQECWLAASAII